MYNLQRQHSLQDWAMQNEYNSPDAQMQRLRKAGLNPNLVYGNGVTQQAGTVRQSSVESWKPEPPTMGLNPETGMNMVLGFADARIKEAQADNLTAQNSVLVQDAILKAAQVEQTTAATGKTKADTVATQLDTDIKQTLRETSAEALKVSVEKLKAEVDQTKVNTMYTLNQDERAAAQSAQSIAEGVERILTMRAERELNPYKKAEIFEKIKEIQYNNKIKTLDIRLKESGIQPGDNMLYRVIKEEVNKLQADIDKVKDGLKSKPPSQRPKQSGQYNPYR